jgi:hypothetical protein
MVKHVAFGRFQMLSTEGFQNSMNLRLIERSPKNGLKFFLDIKENCANDHFPNLSPNPTWPTTVYKKKSP